MLGSLLYVSQSALSSLHERSQIDEILSVARSRNRQLRVTGALVFTQARFAQVLEGPKASIDKLMASIVRDDRHRDVEVVLTEDLPRRRFPGWSLAYSGSSMYVDRHIKPLLQHEMSPADVHERACKLLDIMMNLCTAVPVSST